ncbi:glycosyl transferase family 2 [Chthoniobacter flavus Ellin428]|uniref:Glycosyl transferase family 2 n=1 Tax=Chthoniobacter flavus Ellin428 TaxID=497964 RepID=B4D738_9BACT|nr:glycosyltransferase family 2 protein [Chthoniobacter flavus]EDY17689.1 glycosyl transferase family 2 [Chthoniobacter flavus Ellin428]TCO84104.1 glycosyltransferase involved in cell wall biosynthesis [Chthoniobacter flavus]
MIDRTNVAALIPCYFEAKRIREVAARVKQQLDQVLVVDDGSTDGTEAEARAAGVEVIRHSVNQGKGAAIKTGFRALAERPGIEYALVLDGDGQHAPDEIPRFLTAANETQAPMLVGNRMSDTRTMPFVRKVTNRFMSSQISKVCGQCVPDTQCGFRMIHRDLLQAMVEIATTKFDYETEQLVVASRRGCQIAAVPISTIYGDEKSKIHPLRDSVRFYEMMQRFKREARK